jgi:ribokinase
MTRSDVVVIGGVNTDYVIRGERLPHRGETLQGELFQEGPGGKGANQAVAIARLGCRVELIARLGQDERGEALLSQLSAEGVDVSRVHRDRDAPTGVALIMVDRSGEKQILTALGANQRLTVADIHSVKDTIQSAKVLLTQLEVPIPAVSLGLRLARAAGIKTVLDPAPAVPLSQDILQGECDSARRLRGGNPHRRPGSGPRLRSGRRAYSHEPGCRRSRGAGW